MNSINRSNKKSAMIIETLIYLLVIVFLIFALINVSQSKRYDISNFEKIIKLNNDAEDLCFLLSKTSGIPTNWDENVSTLVIPGLLNNSNSELSINKINNLSTIQEVVLLDKLNISYFKINIQRNDDSYSYLNYGANIPSTELTASYTCYGQMNNNIIQIKIETWS